jgi:hypothetical protein
MTWMQRLVQRMREIDWTPTNPVCMAAVAAEQAMSDLMDAMPEDPQTMELRQCASEFGDGLLLIGCCHQDAP